MPITQSKSSLMQETTNKSNKINVSHNDTRYRRRLLELAPLEFCNYASERKSEQKPVDRSSSKYNECSVTVSDWIPATPSKNFEKKYYFWFFIVMYLFFIFFLFFSSMLK